MHIHIHIHHHSEGEGKTLQELQFLNKKIDKIMNKEEAVALVTSIKAQNEKAKTEIIGKIADLEAKIAAGGEIPAEVADALADLKTSVQGTDDIVPDAPVDGPAPETAA